MINHEKTKKIQGGGRGKKERQKASSRLGAGNVKTKKAKKSTNKTRKITELKCIMFCTFAMRL